MKHLFILINESTGKQYGGTEIPVFNSKQAAKKLRDEYNGGLSTEEGKKWNKDIGCRVTCGPDHWRYKS